jgi:hypothetical protein
MVGCFVPAIVPGTGLKDFVKSSRPKGPAANVNTNNQAPSPPPLSQGDFDTFLTSCGAPLSSCSLLLKVVHNVYTN